jgi:hypothetical protein
MLNEHILTSPLISMDCKSVVRCIEFCMLYVLGSFKQLCNIFFRYFASFYEGTFLQLIVGLIGVFCLYNFIVV